MGGRFLEGGVSRAESSPRTSSEYTTVKAVYSPRRCARALPSLMEQETLV
jgi:hypothetical protein